jgi:hypothetical protein
MYRINEIRGIQTHNSQYTLYTSPGQNVDRSPPVNRETILGGPPVLQARG